jgi:hypothetical protein
MTLISDGSKEADPRRVGQPLLRNFLGLCAQPQHHGRHFLNGGVVHRDRELHSVIIN